MKLPFKLAVAQSFLAGKPRNAEEVRALMLPLYVGEDKLCALANIEDILHGLKTVGVLKTVDGGQSRRYELSAHGRGKVLKAVG